MSDPFQTCNLETYTATEFLGLDLPVPPLLLSPWLPEAGLTMIHAPTGIGKTLFALASAVAIASGRAFLKFTAPSPRRVFYLDGEMPASLMQKRLADAVNLANNFDGSLFSLFCAAKTDNEAPDLCTLEGQALVEEKIANFKPDVLFIDNLSAFCRTGKENEAESWRPTNSFLMKQRREGRAVVTIHHDNKSGDQRGTSKKLDALDTVIHLKRPGNFIKGQPARFEVHFTKCRHFWGDQAASFEASLTEQGWVTSEIQNDEFAEARAMKSGGKSLREIASITGIPKSTLARQLGT